MEVSDAKMLKVHEAENAESKRLLSEQMMEMPESVAGEHNAFEWVWGTF
ncbi:hypothetical protein [Sulfitobacter mediterraneus]|nr:hypothetical protein [Sulfitobacter mediterraneus]UWR11550.1 hypothetical protein K3753_01300 [Sulfitobacter mediterraneus]